MKDAQQWTPEKLKALSRQEVQALLPELRQQIIDAVSNTGGHLASNLGAVELTVALHRVFDSPKDKILFDVGHQSYVHKILTGRGDRMHTLRQLDGLAGFPRREESPHDAYGTGHASTALSAALGMARARDLRGGDEQVVVVLGDGALTGGMCYEALNDAGSRDTRMIVILNDNQMSIAPNVGAVKDYLTRLRSSKGWLSAKKAVGDALLHVPLVGKGLHRLLQRFKNNIRNIFVKDVLFQAFGFRYLGPVDGHDEPGLERILKRAMRFEKPVLLHIVTQKGKGYPYAEQSPAHAHGMPAFDPANGLPRGKAGGASFGAAAGRLLCELAQQDKSIVAITAAMADSTGLKPFYERYPERLFDVGIAEEHAVVMAAGMAAAGLKPVVAVYDTFLQRAYDQLVVDVCLQKLPVTFIIDRAALGGEDGPSHHGVFGTSFLRHIPGMTLLQPRCVAEMEQMLRWALQHEGPVAIRYPRSEAQGQPAYAADVFRPGAWERLSEGTELALVATGPMVAEALVAAGLLREQGHQLAVINASSVKPLDEALLQQLTDRGIPYVVLEEQALLGGLGSAILEAALQRGFAMPEQLIALPDSFVPQGSHAQLLKRLQMDGEQLLKALKPLLRRTA